MNPVMNPVNPWYGLNLRGASSPSILTGYMHTEQDEQLGDDDGRPAEAVSGHDAEEAQSHLHLPDHQRRVAARLLDVEEHGRVRADYQRQAAGETRRQTD